MGRPLLLLMAAGWAVQAASGAAFGIASYAFYGRFPDIHGVAVTALFIKAACAVVGFFLAGIACLKWSRMQRHAFSIGLLSSMLALVALSAAAFLRWFS